MPSDRLLLLQPPSTFHFCWLLVILACFLRYLSPFQFSQQILRHRHIQLLDIQDATIADVHAALLTREVSCVEVISMCLARIEQLNPFLNAVISLNPEALDLAKQIDKDLLLQGTLTGPLSCIPVMLKDNFDSVGMVTTGGSLALANNRASSDGAAVSLMKEAGAIVLGKANLHEMALEGLTVSSFGGQTINPYDNTRTPGGSSGGTAVAVAAGFSVLGTGTDTVNSLRNPASANGLFSIRPTRGLVSRKGVIGVSWTQDAVGPMARSVEDLAVALTVMSQHRDEKRIDYSAGLHTGSLLGLRLGIIDGFFNRTAGDETTPVIEAMDHMVSFLESAGVTFINLTDTSVFNSTDMLAKLDVQQWEFRQEMDDYLLNSTDDQAHSFADLYCGPSFLVIPAQYNHVRAAASCSPSGRTYNDRLGRIEALRTVLGASFSFHNLDALIYPQQKNLVVSIGSPSQSGRNGILAAVSGYPSVAIPAGFSSASPDAPVGIPIGMELLGRPWSESRLLNLAALISRGFPIRKIAPSVNVSVPWTEYGAMPIIKPTTNFVSSEYPLGML